MIVLVGGEKGGPGKSTTAQNLAAYYVIKRNLDVLLVDADAQATTADWVDERNEDPELPVIHCIQKQGRIEKTLLDSDKRYDMVIVDVGGHDNEALRSAMTVADLMLIPLRPKRRDLKTLSHVSELVTLAKALNHSVIVRSLITQAPTLPSLVPRILDAKEVCISFGLEPLQSMTCMRNVYDDIEEGGRSVFESTDKKAIKEVEQIGDEVFEILEAVK